MSEHLSVMKQEIVDFLSPIDGGVYLDCTFGAGGHTKAILNSSDCFVHAVDRDENSLKYAEDLKKEYGNRFTFHNCKFSEMTEFLHKSGIEKVNGAILDAGVSSMQLDMKERGFSFQGEGPLLMTMGRNDITAEVVVNDYTQENLVEILTKYGDETFNEARRIATAICDARARKRIITTKQLADIISRAKRHINPRINPATLSFQAIRIEVNNELSELESAIEQSCKMLNKGGKMLAITFHSLESRLVKIMMKDIEKLSEGAFCRMMKGKAYTTKRAEIVDNVRSRSAIMRGIERIK